MRADAFPSPYGFTAFAIDANMRAHMAFLKQQYAAGKFLVSGRKVPRDGGIILALGKSRDEEGLSESFESGVRAAASLAARHLREGYEVKVLTNSGWLTRPLRGAANQMGMLDAFARVGMTRDPLGSAILQLMKSSGRRDTHTIFWPESGG